MRKDIIKVEDILDNSDKAELVEKFSEVLDTEGCRVVVIAGVPNEKKGLDINVYQTGFRYNYELFGFIREGINIVDEYGDREED